MAKDVLIREKEIPTYDLSDGTWYVVGDGLRNFLGKLFGFDAPFFEDTAGEVTGDDDKATPLPPRPPPGELKMLMLNPCYEVSVRQTQTDIEQTAYPVFFTLDPVLVRIVPKTIVAVADMTKRDRERFAKLLVMGEQNRTKLRAAAANLVLATG